jgi:phospholipid/cholesterol/gamma-HCH transport system ATP-binding protein
MTPSGSSSPAFATQSVGITVAHLTKTFGSTTVLRDINFSVKPGEIFALMGPSGSGKTVIMKHVIGLEQPTSGEVRVGEFNAADPETRRKVHLAMVFQAGALFNSLSVYDNLALYPARAPDRHRTANPRAGAARAVDPLPGEGRRKIPAELSGGMKKRVAIARALVMEPQIMLYDEPTAELDPILSATVCEIIATVREQTGVTSFVVTHDRSLALGIADRMAIIMDGRIQAVGRPAEFTHHPDPAIADFMNPVIDPQNPRFRKP